MVKPISYFCRDSSLNIVILCVANLRVEIEHGTNLNWSSEPDVIHVHAEWPGLAKHKAVGPSQLESLPHDEASKYLVESISVLGLTNDKVLEFSIFKPD